VVELLHANFKEKPAIFIDSSQKIYVFKATMMSIKNLTSMRWHLASQKY